MKYKLKEDQNNILFHLSEEDISFFQKETGKTREEIQLLYTDSLLFFNAIEDYGFFREGTRQERDEILRQIRDREFDNDPENFKEGLDYTRQNHKYGDYLNSRPLKSIKKMKLFKVKNEYIGIGLKKFRKTSEYSELVSLYNSSLYKRAGFALLLEAVDMGGKYLECMAIDGNDILKGLYISIGFKIYKTITNKKTNITYYFMKHKDVKD